MKVLSKVINIITTLAVCIAVLAAVALIGVRLVGLKPYTVLSGSMEPTYPTGSLIYVKTVDYKSLQVGDPITFMLGEDTVATHRIVEILPDEQDPDTLRYATKGDNNEDADARPVHYKNILGKPVFCIPYLGFAASYIQTPPGKYIAIAACAVILLLAFIPDLLSDKDPKKQSSDEDK